MNIYLTELTFTLYLSGCSCCLSGFLIGCVQPVEGPGRTGWVSHGRMVQHLEPFPCSSFPFLHDGSRGQEVSGLSGCPSFCWHCGLLSSCTEEHRRRRRVEAVGKLENYQRRTRGRSFAHNTRHNVTPVYDLSSPRMLNFMWTNKCEQTERSRSRRNLSVKSWCVLKVSPSERAVVPPCCPEVLAHGKMLGL